MADLCCEYTMGGTGLILNDDSGANRLVCGPDGVAGLDGRPIRSQIDPAGVDHGGIVHDKWWAHRIVIFSGFVHIQSMEPTISPTYFALVNAVEAAWISGLEGLLNTEFNLTWTPSGGSGKTLACTYGTPDGEIEFSGTMLDKRFRFALVADNPTIS